MSHPLPLVNVSRADVVRISLTPAAALAGAPDDGATALLRPAILDQDWPDVTNELITASAADLAGLLASRQLSARERPRRTSTGRPRWMASSGPISMSTGMARSRRRRGRPAAMAGEDLHPLAGLPIAVRTWSSRRACRPRPVRASSRAGYRRMTRPSSRGCVPRVCRFSARPIWTSSRWAHSTSTRHTDRRTTRGISTGFQAARVADRPPRSPLSRRRWRSAPTPAGRSASPRPSPGPSGRSRRMAG